MASNERRLIRCLFGNTGDGDRFSYGLLTIIRQETYWQLEIKRMQVCLEWYPTCGDVYPLGIAWAGLFGRGVQFDHRMEVDPCDPLSGQNNQFCVCDEDESCGAEGHFEDGFSWDTCMDCGKEILGSRIPWGDDEDYDEDDMTTWKFGQNPDDPFDHKRTARAMGFVVEPEAILFREIRGQWWVRDNRFEPHHRSTLSDAQFISGAVLYPSKAEALVAASGIDFGPTGPVYPSATR